MADDTIERILGLIDFLADFDAQKNPPVHDIGAYGLFRLDEPTRHDVPGVKGMLHPYRQVSKAMTG